MTDTGSDQTGTHLRALPGSDWTIWRDALLRTTGFPADGLDLLTAPGCAAAADAHLDGGDAEAFGAAYEAACAEASAALRGLAADPLLREALSWQNPTAAKIITGLTEPMRRNDSRHRVKRRGHEDTLTRYWQRYCGKNDTIGFFGPVTWVTVDPASPATVVHSGPSLVRRRLVYPEFWGLQAFSDALAADPVVGPHLPVRVQPHLAVGAELLGPDGPIETSVDELALLARCDGRTAAEAAPDDADRARLAGLAARGLVRWGVPLPYNSFAYAALRAGLSTLPDDEARKRALSALDRLDAALAAVADAAGDADRLAVALDALAVEFTALTGAAPQQRSGEMYAGRELCFEDTARDLDVTIGADILSALTGPLSVLLPAARWMSAEVAHGFMAALRTEYDRLRGDADSLPMATLWPVALAYFAGPRRPTDTVVAEFARRFEELFGLDTEAPGTRRVWRDSAALADRAAALFPVSRPVRPIARLHSPDIQIAATGVDAIRRGEYTMVLGELHAAWPTLDNAALLAMHPDPTPLYAAHAADIGRQFRLLFPQDFPHYTARIAPILGADDRQLAFAAAPGADPDRVVAVAELTVVERDGELVAVHRDGRAWPVRDVFATLAAWVATDAFKMTGTRPHNPRVTVDRMVIARETWRTTIGASGIAVPKDQSLRYLAARRWRRDLGLPEKVYVRIATETKPVYVDLTSPRYVAAFARMLRFTRDTVGDDVALTVSEMLPEPSQAWVPDSAGRRYFSELRVQLRDPAG